MNQLQNRWKITLMALGLLLLSVSLYSQTFGFSFVHLDDTNYIVKNDVVRRGISLNGIRWAFTTFYASNWHPLTWLSHQIDVSLFGLNAGRHHITSVTLHAATSVILFLAFFRMTGAAWRSFIVAALFACHPLHVESVAWIAERKDVLSGLFFALTLLFYERYARDPRIKNYSLLLISFTLGLLSKPMLVTVPCVLLLMDYWPLRRTSFDTTTESDTERVRVPLKQLVLEKLPLFALSLASSVVTYLAQQRGGAMVFLQAQMLPVHLRLENALVSYAAYIKNAFWPSALAFYPISIDGLPRLTVMASIVVLLIISVISLLNIRRRPYLAVGWLWYIGMLVPVIGLVQIGTQAMADRYMYLPSIGFSIMVVWAVADAIPATTIHRKALIVMLVLTALTALSATTIRQEAHWRNTQTLQAQIRESFKNTPPIKWLSLFSRGDEYYRAGNLDLAALCYKEAISINPRFAYAYYHLGNVLSELGRPEEAIPYYRRAIELLPSNARIHNDLGAALVKIGRLQEAQSEFSEARRIDPYY